MKNINFFIVLSWLILFLSCGAPRMIKKNFICYNEKDTGIDSLLNTNGYYTISGINRDKIHRRPIQSILFVSGDTIRTNILFFKDGIFLFGFHNYDQKISDYIEDVINRRSSGRNHPFYIWGFWGKYTIDGDTIKAQYINHPGMTNTWMGYESWFKVIDRNTIKLIASRKLFYDKFHKDKSEMDLVFLNDKDCLNANFIPLSAVPPSDTWLKKRKWFWCDKNDMKIYKRKLKDNNNE